MKKWWKRSIYYGKNKDDKQWGETLQTSLEEAFQFLHNVPWRVGASAQNSVPVCLYNKWRLIHPAPIISTSLSSIFTFHAALGPRLFFGDFFTWNNKSCDTSQSLSCLFQKVVKCFWKSPLQLTQGLLSSFSRPLNDKSSQRCSFMIIGQSRWYCGCCEPSWVFFKHRTFTYSQHAPTGFTSTKGLSH